ncbi:MAG: MFS transporter [Caulobacterales bacterium]|nr:MFS transporter [Caulobacterales bacterium]MCA0371751.1 MFS transporter [Pseudomonadota bacterium]
MEKPRQSVAGLINLSFGFFGIQIGFALQNANMSRIFQSLGEKLDNLPVLWIAAPLTGLLVQPIIGYFSDRTWGPLGRRRPYFLAGAILAAIALFVMPNVPGLLFAAMMLWMLDASLNISMEPFRAFVGDSLREDQHTQGYAIQTAFIGAGAVVGSIFPYILTHLGVSNEAAEGAIPDSVRYSFWFGGAALFLAVLWTIITTKEFSPEEMAKFENKGEIEQVHANIIPPLWHGLVWLGLGILVFVLVKPFDLKQEIYLLGGILAFFGILLINSNLSKGRNTGFIGGIMGDLMAMPPIMKQLSIVQFFSWSALFIMWIFTTPVVAQYVFNAPNAESANYNEAGNWVGVLMSIYNGVAAIAALVLLPSLSKRFGRAKTHMICLIIGALSYASFFVLRDKYLLIISEIGIGILWASILAMPYSILASTLPQNKLGIYMGIFNIFIVIPQLLVATIMGTIMKTFFPTEPIYTMAFAAGSLAIAAFTMSKLKEV